MMAKVHPHEPTSSSSSSSASCNKYMSSERETFTLWMKSLVFHGNGCTVFNSKGEIVYRIDNYGEKSSNEVHLMDLQGKALFTIQKKRSVVSERWDGYKWSGGDSTIIMDKDDHEQQPFFQVRKSYCKFLMKNSTTTNCQVNMGCTDESNSAGTCYKIVGSLARKSAFQIIDDSINGSLVAEVTQKQSSSGVVLGSDVLTLVVEPGIDHSLIMALVTVHGLINHQM